MDFSLIARREQTALAKRELKGCNEVSERYGLALTEQQIDLIVRRESEALKSAGRVSFGQGVAAKLAFAFCDSPYVWRENYVETLLALQDDFYELKNDAEGLLSDDELIDSMRRVFNGRAQGSLDYLEGLNVGELYRAANHEDEDGADE